MIELRANVTRAEWYRDFVPPTVLPEGMSESEWYDMAAPYVAHLVTIHPSAFPDALWRLSLPEKVATDSDEGTGSYEVGMTWAETDDGWAFDYCPLAGLDGAMAAKIGVQNEVVRYSLTLVNQSSESWKRTLVWLCFNHSLARQYYQHRNYVFSGDTTILTPPDKWEKYSVKGRERNWWPDGGIAVTESLITTVCRDSDGREFSVGIGAREAMMVGQNPTWPCTDIGLLFGDVPAGAQATVDGAIYFVYGSPLDVLALYRKDFGPSSDA